MSALDPVHRKRRPAKPLTPEQQQAEDYRKRIQMAKRVQTFGRVGNFIGVLVAGAIVLFTYKLWFPGPGVLAPASLRTFSQAPVGAPIAKQHALGLSWQLHPRTGWGTYGINLVVQLLRRPDLYHYYPVLLVRPHSACFREEYGTQARELITQLWESQSEWRRSALAEYVTDDGDFAPHFDSATVRLSFPVLHSVPGEFGTVPRIRGPINVGACFFETEDLLPDAVERAHTYTALIAGSTWNEVTLEEHGLKPVYKVLQGVDLQLFRPANGTAAAAAVAAVEAAEPTSAPAAAPSKAKTRRISRETIDFSPLDGKFVVFSGGKLELRKGQDIVIAAFKRFLAKHPDAILAVAWHNEWPSSVASIALSPPVHVQGAPAIGSDDRIQLSGWLQANGLPKSAVFDLGRPSQSKIAALLQRANVALFCNRAEGGTNLVAMETLAAGVPVIISSNTGHLDIASEENSFLLKKQDRLEGRRYAGWQESSAEEAASLLERVFADHRLAEGQGEAAGEPMRYALVAGSESERRATAAAVQARARFGWPRSVQALDAAVWAVEEGQAAAEAAAKAKAKAAKTAPRAEGEQA